MGRRALLLLYAAAAYLVFFGTFLYAIGFVGCVGVPTCVAGTATVSWPTALGIDLILLGLFAVQHSVMARRPFKQWWTTIIPRSAERSTYVLLSSLVLILLFWQWQPLPGTAWTVHDTAAREILWGLFALGWLILLVSTFLIDHFDLFGLRQAWLHFREQPYTHPPFTTKGLYHYSRNPLMLGFIIAFWAAPTMSVARLVFAIAATGYILVGIALEERDHAFYLGAQYERYRERTSMLLPLPPRGDEASLGAVSQQSDR